MKIVLEYRNPTPMHCDVAVFLNGALAGVLRMRQDEVGDFHQIICHGCHATIDSFLSRGRSVPPDATALTRPQKDNQ